MKPLSSALRCGVPAVACFVLGGVQGASAQTAPQAAPATAPASVAPAAPAAPAATPTFAVWEYVVEGNTVLPTAAIEKAVTPFLGEGKTITQVEAARAALEKTYQYAGYLTVFVDLPEQEVSDGVITLKVMEGRVERLAVTGAKYFSQGYIRARVPELAEGKVPNFNVVQAQLAEVNRTEDRRVQPVLRPGHEPGAAEVELKVTDQLPVHGTVELNNNHAQYNKPWRAVGTLRYDNLFQRDHSMQLLAMVNPQDPKESKALGFSYNIPEPGGDAWAFSAVWSDSNLQTISSVAVLGKGEVIGLKRQWALPTSGGVNHQLTFGPDFKNMKERVVVGSDQVATPLRYMPFTLGYAGSWLHEGGGLSLWQHNLVFGVSSLFKRQVDCGYGLQDQFGCKRDGADGGFAYLRLDARHTEPIQGWSLNARVAGQMATQALVGAEQYALGGTDNIRGYLSAEVIGDQGLMGSLQLNAPNLARRADAASSNTTTGPLQELTPYVFIDGGMVRVINPSSGQRGSQSLGALGGGLKLKAYQRFNLSTDLAWALRAATVTQAHSWRAHLRLSADF